MLLAHRWFVPWDVLAEHRIIKSWTDSLGRGKKARRPEALL